MKEKMMNQEVAQEVVVEETKKVRKPRKTKKLETVEAKVENAATTEEAVVEQETPTVDTVEEVTEELVKSEPETPQENETKQDTFLTIQEVTELYKAFGIKCANPTAKGNYRIMGSKSSLNVLSKKGYYIYTSASDLELIYSARLEFEDLVIERGTNARDKQRPNTIICTALDTLKALLEVYAKNPNNAIAAA